MIRSHIKDNKCEVHIEGKTEDIIIEFKELLDAFYQNDDLKLVIALAILQYLNEKKNG